MKMFRVARKLWRLGHDDYTPEPKFRVWAESMDDVVSRLVPSGLLSVEDSWEVVEIEEFALVTLDEVTKTSRRFVLEKAPVAPPEKKPALTLHPVSLEYLVKLRDAGKKTAADDIPFAVDDDLRSKGLAAHFKRKGRVHGIAITGKGRDLLKELGK